MFKEYRYTNINHDKVRNYYQISIELEDTEFGTIQENFRISPETDEQKNYNPVQRNAWLEAETKARIKVLYRHLNQKQANESRIPDIVNIPNFAKVTTLD